MNSFRSTFRVCHSEERSDEESVFFRRCEDPSLTLRMTYRKRICNTEKSTVYVFLRNKVTKNLFSAKSLPKVRRSFAYAQDDIERNLVSALTHIRSLATLIRIPDRNFEFFLSGIRIIRKSYRANQSFSARLALQTKNRHI